MKKFKLGTASLSVLLGSVCLTGCGNKQIFDFNKSFNVAVEKNGEIVSVVGIDQYSDYSGSQVQFVTEDGLRVVTSTLQTQLVKAETENALSNYVDSLCGGNIENVVDYNVLQGVDVDFSHDSWNKDVFDIHYTYDKAIILSDDLLKLINDDNAAEGSLESYAVSLVGSADKVVRYNASKQK